MTAQLAQRGPDAEGVLADGPVVLGHRRLKIIDLEGGAQPMSNEDDTVWVVFNGEIYNFPDLRAELEALGHRFRTRCDTEAIVHAYEEYDTDCFRRFNGMFALAIWDRRMGRLLFARDRMGKKPLYYAELGRDLAFASELKALEAHPHVSREIDPGSLCRYLAFEFVPAPHAIYRGVRKLPAGHYLVWDGHEATVRSYWDLEFRPCPYPDLHSAAEELRDRLGESVRRRLVSDVPLGVLLSGGIDSSGVAALAARHTNSLKTFSIGFNEPSFDESRFSRLVAQSVGSEHTEHCFSPTSLIDLIPEVFRYLDEPFADPSVLPTYLLCRHTRRSVTVALGGDGGDELFLGYPTFPAARFAYLWARAPRWARGGFAAAVRRLPVATRNLSLDFLLKQFVKGMDYAPPVREQVWLGAFTREEQARLMTADARAALADQDPYTDLVRDVEGCTALDRLDRSAYHYARYYLGEGVLTKVDRASMANSLEVRAPLLDPAVVELATEIPVDWRLGKGGKRILREALSPVLPPAIVRRRKKGFGIPLTAWLRRELVPLCDELLDSCRLRRQGLFDPGVVAGLLQEHRAGMRDHRKALWTLLAFQLWQSNPGGGGTTSREGGTA
jgi:asparagine synthase (glutamine-hydrolysing)